MLAFVVLFVFTMGVSAATVDVADTNAYDDTATTLTYVIHQTDPATAQNCTLYDNINGSWGISPLASVDTTLINGSNTFSITSTYAGFARGDTAFFNVLCSDNATGTAKDATNGTITFYVYTSLYSTPDLNEQVIDILGTGVYAGLQWVDLLVLLAILGVALSVLAGIMYKGGKIFGL